MLLGNVLGQYYTFCAVSFYSWGYCVSGYGAFSILLCLYKSQSNEMISCNQGKRQSQILLYKMLPYVFAAGLLGYLYYEMQKFLKKQEQWLREQYARTPQSIIVVEEEKKQEPCELSKMMLTKTSYPRGSIQQNFDEIPEIMFQRACKKQKLNDGSTKRFLIMEEDEEIFRKLDKKDKSSKKVTFEAQKKESSSKSSIKSGAIEGKQSRDSKKEGKDQKKSSIPEQGFDLKTAQIAEQNGPSKPKSILQNTEKKKDEINLNINTKVNDTPLKEGSLFGNRSQQKAGDNKMQSAVKKVTPTDKSSSLFANSSISPVASPLFPSAKPAQKALFEHKLELALQKQGRCIEISPVSKKDSIHEEPNTPKFNSATDKQQTALPIPPPTLSMAPLFKDQKKAIQTKKDLQKEPKTDLMASFINLPKNPAPKNDINPQDVFKTEVIFQKKAVDPNLTSKGGLFDAKLLATQQAVPPSKGFLESISKNPTQKTGGLFDKAASAASFFPKPAVTENKDKDAVKPTASLLAQKDTKKQQKPVSLFEKKTGPLFATTDKPTVGGLFAAASSDKPAGGLFSAAKSSDKSAGGLFAAKSATSVFPASFSINPAPPTAPTPSTPANPVADPLKSTNIFGGGPPSTLFSGSSMIGKGPLFGNPSASAAASSNPTTIPDPPKLSLFGSPAPSGSGSLFGGNPSLFGKPK